MSSVSTALVVVGVLATLAGVAFVILDYLGRGDTALLTDRICEGRSVRITGCRTVVHGYTNHCSGPFLAHYK